MKMTLNERQQKNKPVEYYANFIYRIWIYNFKVKRQGDKIHLNKNIVCYLQGPRVKLEELSSVIKRVWFAQPTSFVNIKLIGFVQKVGQAHTTLN